MAEEGKEFTPIETQEAFEEAITERLEAARREEREKFSDYEDLKNQLATANETNSTQAGKIKALEAEALKRRVADETGLPSALANRLTGSDEDALRKDADSLLKIMKLQHKAPPMKNPDHKPSGNDALKRLLSGLKND